MGLRSYMVHCASFLHRKSSLLAAYSFEKMDDAAERAPQVIRPWPSLSPDRFFCEQNIVVIAISGYVFHWFFIQKRIFKLHILSINLKILEKLSKWKWYRLTSNSCVMVKRRFHIMQSHCDSFLFQFKVVKSKNNFINRFWPIF